jgi:small neutral amino acid transporter SnatA (MarC family)
MLSDTMRMQARFRVPGLLFAHLLQLGMT